VLQKIIAPEKMDRKGHPINIPVIIVSQKYWKDYGK